MPKASAPLTLTLYGPDDEELNSYVRSIVPYGVFKRAVRFIKQLGVSGVSDLDHIDLTALDEEMTEALASLVVFAFGDKFTVEQLENGADLGDMMTLVENILSRASAMQGNPTPPPA